MPPQMCCRPDSVILWDMCAESPSALGPESSSQAIVHICSVSMLTPVSKYRAVVYKICPSQPSPGAGHGLWPLWVAAGGRFLSAGGLGSSPGQG